VETPNKRQRLREGSSLPASLPLIRQLGVGEGSSLPALLPLIRPLVAAEVQGGGGGSHFSPQSGNAAAVTSSNRPESLGLMRTRNFPKPLRNPSVEELKARLRDLHANASLHAAKIGQAYSDCAERRMTSAHYDGDWYDHRDAGHASLCIVAVSLANLGSMQTAVRMQVLQACLELLRTDCKAVVESWEFASALSYRYHGTQPLRDPQLPSSEN